MRQLKFRVWNKLSKKFCLDTEDGYFGQDENFSKGIFTIGSWDKHDVIQQYTGIKDKTGKEIYEGDILKGSGISKDYIGYVYYCDDDACFLLDICGSSCYFNNKYTVIGNIFENPTLLD